MHLIEVQDIVKHFPLQRGLFSKPKSWIKAVDGVSFQVRKGESFGLVGESGCGKTTLGKLILNLMTPQSGRILFNGKDLTALNRKQMRPYRKDLQVIYQDPHASLNPRMKVEAIITEPLAAFHPVTKHEQREVAAEMLKKVGMQPSDLGKYPHEFSGGQRQRIGIARALCLNPSLIVADEPVTALDVSIQAQIMNLLLDLKASFQFSSIIISHDLSVVDHLCDRIAVMYMGVIVEMAPSNIFSFSPRHPYTKALISSVPLPDPSQRKPMIALDGEVPSPIDPPPGCAFFPRCPYGSDRCSVDRPRLTEANPDHKVACWLNDGKGISESMPIAPSNNS